MKILGPQLKIFDLVVGMIGVHGNGGSGGATTRRHVAARVSLHLDLHHLLISPDVPTTTAKKLWNTKVYGNYYDMINLFTSIL